MKRYAFAIFLLSIISTILLHYHFGYSIRLSIHHLIITAIAHIGVLMIFHWLRYISSQKKNILGLINAGAYLYWITLCLFYSLVLGSNYFWGNTITFDILRQYLGNISAVLSILPVEKWLLISGFLLFLLVFSGFFFFIRIRKSVNVHMTDTHLMTFLKKWKWGLVVFILIAAFLGKNIILDWKRTLHFEQEPLTYFVLGPMWEIHTDRLLMEQKPRTTADDACIEQVTVKEKNEKLVVIILVDALRSDHLPMYGYERNTSPFLDSLYRSGALQALPYSFSGSSNTIGGVSSLFFSRDWNSLNMSQLNLMQYFKKSGYKTYAFLTGYHSGWYGLSAMYRTSCDYFYESTSAYNHAVDDDLVTLKKIESTRLQPNSFVYIHLLSTHEIGKRDNRFRVFMPDKIGLTTSQRTPIINNYDNGILQADFVCRQIFNKLQRDSLLPNTTLFIVSDHGNLMGEDNQYGHAGGLHEKLLEIPILMYSQDSSWHFTRKTGSLKDLAPSITEKIFGDKPTCWAGQSLFMNSGSFYQTTASAATVKTDLYNATISEKNDSLQLSIYSASGVLQSTREKKGRGSWSTTYQK
jgi:glucan phosphoethanolaminetransferase (alkaline phosphatase superfamily)